MPSLYVTFIAPLLIVIVARRARFLTVDGCIAAFFVGAAVIDAGLTTTIQLLTFFFLSSAITKFKQKEKDFLLPYKEETKQQSNVLVKKSGRDYRQVLATGLIPALCCLLRHFSFLPPILNSHWYSFYFAFMATNFGDTLASEIGMLSKQKPMLIIDWNGRVAPGVDGGVTLLGTIASIIAGGIIGAIKGTPTSFISGIFCGLFGSIIDSIMGALIQSKPKLSTTKTINKDIDGNDGQLIYSHQPINYHWWETLNAGINFASASITAILFVFITQYTSINILPLLIWISLQLIIHLLYPQLTNQIILILSRTLTVLMALFLALSHPYQIAIICLIHSLVVYYYRTSATPR